LRPDPRLGLRFTRAALRPGRIAPLPFPAWAILM
jgi:hypothetical protein